MFRMGYTPSLLQFFQMLRIKNTPSILQRLLHQVYWLYSTAALPNVWDRGYTKYPAALPLAYSLAVRWVNSLGYGILCVEYRRWQGRKQPCREMFCCQALYWASNSNIAHVKNYALTCTHQLECKRIYCDVVLVKICYVSRYLFTLHIWQAVELIQSSFEIWFHFILFIVVFFVDWLFILPVYAMAMLVIGLVCAGVFIV